MVGEAKNEGAAGLRAELDLGRVSLSWFTMGSVPLVELASRQSREGGVVIDMQHGLWDRASLHLAVSCAARPVLVRVADTGAQSIGSALDSGAAGILVPSVSTAAQAREAVGHAHYPPRGMRSGGGVRPLGSGFADYHAQAEQTLVGVMVETTEGVANAAKIAAVPGVDFLFIGTGDLSLSIGCFPALDERLEDACRKVLEASRARGKPCGIFTASVEAARRRLEEGFAVVVVADDIGVVKNGFAGAYGALDPRR